MLHSNGAYFDFNEANGFFGSIGTKGNPTIEPPRICSHTDDYIDVGIQVKIPDEYLVSGTNTLAIYPEQGSYVMYDYIALREVEDYP